MACLAFKINTRMSVSTSLRANSGRRKEGEQHSREHFLGLWVAERNEAGPLVFCC